MAREQYFVLTKRILFVVFLLFILRGLFYLFNPSYFSNIGFLEALIPLVYGLRFDLATAFIFNAPLILLSFIPLKSYWYPKVLLVVYLISNFLCLLLNVVDIEYFEFNGKRLTKDIFMIGGDMLDQIPQLAIYYWFVPLLMVILSYFLVWYFIKTVKRRKVWKYSWFLFPIHTVFYLIIAFVIVRGGVQMRSISTKDAFIFDKHEKGNIALNSAYTLIRSLDDKSIPLVAFYNTDELAKEVLKDRRSFSLGYTGGSKNNIVILIIESLSQEYIDEGYTPFLKSLGENEGLYFNNNFANGRRSIEALPSILLGIPSVLKVPVSQSEFQTNDFLSLPRVLGDNGYDVSFFHGGKTGTMDFDSFTRSIGIKKYYGKEDYPDQSHYDGSWGIFDHYFYRFFVEELSKGNKPFFSVFFSLSSHQPYSIPKEFNGKFSKGTLEIHESMQYADKSIELFFENAKKQDWYKNTLFIITADHTQKLSRRGYSQGSGKFRVPLIFYHPSKKLVSKKRVTQHADILPSVIDFLGMSPKKNLFIGSSVFNDDQGVAINGNNGHFYFTEGDKEFVIELDKKNVDIPESTREHFNALYQYIINGLKKNSL